MRTALALIALLCVCHPADGEGPRRVQFGPPSSSVAFRAYKLGLLPVDGGFTRFTGWLTYDPKDHGSCQVQLSVDTTSLTTEDASMHDIVAGPDFLNVARFPSLAYAGACNQESIAGTLEMHGVAHPFSLSAAWLGGRLEAEGRLIRSQWGLTAMPTWAGRTIRIQVTIALP